MHYKEKVDEALLYIDKKIKIKPEFAIILGSGLGRLADSVKNAVIIPYSDIPYWPRSTAPGHAGKLVIGYLEGRPVAIMQGRVHYYEGYTMEEISYPIRVLGKLGIKALIATNASGGIKADILPGTIVGISDHINFMGDNPLIGENDDEIGTRFPDMSQTYDREFLNVLQKSAEKEGIVFEKGVYIGFSGPSFETPAEIVMSRILGADIVGMSTVPEVITANHMGIRVCGISCVANYAAGMSDNKLTHHEVLQTMNKSSDSICRLICTFLKDIVL